MKLSKREKILICFLLVAGGIYVFYNYVYQPVREKTMLLADENGRLKAAIQVAERARTIHADIGVEKEKIKEEYEELALKVPESPYLPEVISYLEDSAGEAGVKLLSLSSQESIPEDELQVMGMGQLTGESSSKQEKETDNELEGVNAYSLYLTVRGSYYNILTYMLKIEKAPRIYTIDSVTMSKESDGDSINLDMVVTTYYDNKSLLGIKGVEETIKPGEGRDNPFY